MQKEIFMKKLRFLGVSALALILGMTVLGCKDDPEETPPAGQLTLTGLTGHDGDYVMAQGQSPYSNLNAIGSVVTQIPPVAKAAAITNGSALLTIFDATGGGSLYTGNDTVTFSVVIYNVEVINQASPPTPVAGGITTAVNLTNGSGNGTVTITP
jgi:hypothetical protein